MRVVVLGADGFLGSAMTRYFANSDHRIIAYCRNATTKFQDLESVTTMVGDIRDSWILADAMLGADIVYHFASGTHPSRFFARPSAECTESLLPLMTVMEMAAYRGVRKLVFPSSGGTIYANSNLPRTENSATNPQSPYAILKLASEQLLHHASRRGEFAVDVYRIGNPYGPGQQARAGQGVIPHWVDAVTHQLPIRVFGDGTSKRDYIFIGDVCRLMASSCERMDMSDTFNLGTGRAISLNELLEAFQQHLPNPHPVEYTEARPCDIHSVALSPEKLLSYVRGFRFTSLDEGISRTIGQRALA